MHRKLKSFGFWGSLLIMMAMAASVGAESVSKLEPILVSAQKQLENIQDVPVSMDVFTEDMIENAGINDIQEMTRFAPNVYLSASNAQNAIIIRGLSPFNNALFGPAGFFVDGVSYPSLFMHNPELFDVERIEVLRGPQGTLYGRNTESGAINVITQKPGNRFEGKVYGEYYMFDSSGGSSPGWRLGGNVNAPLVADKLAFRLAGQLNQSDGYITNTFNDDDKAGKIDHQNLRGILRFTPGDRWDITLASHVMHNDDGKGYFRFFDGPYRTDSHEIAYNGKYQLEDRGNNHSLSLQYDHDSFRIVSITGLLNYHRDFTQDFDCTPRPLGNSEFDYDDQQFSQEIRIQAPEDAKTLKWLGGLYYLHQNTDVRFFQPATKMDRDSDLKSTSYALFGQATYTAFDRLHLTAGLRYEITDTKGEMDFTSARGKSRFNKDMDFNELLPKVSLSYDITKRAMIYVSVAKGYLAGGYAYHTATNQNNLTYDPEYSWNYEMGLKTSWLDERLIANLAVFYTQVKDKQVMQYVPGVLGSMEISNAAEAHTQGFELEIKAKPAAGWDIIAGLGYVQAEIDDWSGVNFNPVTKKFVPFDYSGNKLPNVPQYTYNLGIQYAHPVGLFGRVDLLGTGDFQSNAANTVEVGGYELVNLRLGYDSQNLGVVLWCNNLFDKQYTAISMDWGGSVLGQDGIPRSMGVKVTYKF